MAKKMTEKEMEDYLNPKKKIFLYNIVIWITARILMFGVPVGLILTLAVWIKWAVTSLW